MYRICKIFEFQSAHILSKHKGKCRFPHGHTYRIEITLSADELDQNDMVCDFHIITDLIKTYIKEKLDHRIFINSNDLENVKRFSENAKVKIFERKDPTSEVLAKEIFDHLKSELKKININPTAKIEKVRVWETTSAYAEYSE